MRGALDPRATATDLGTQRSHRQHNSESRSVSKSLPAESYQVALGSNEGSLSNYLILCSPETWKSTSAQ